MTGPPTRLRCGYFGAAAGLMLLMTAGPTWGQPSEVTKVLASDAAAGDEFGFTVSIDGDTAVVGAPFNDDDGSSSGSAYIFQQDPADPDAWVEIRILAADDADLGDHFGTSVSISGDFAIVGARLNDDNGSNSGSAYIFYRDAGGPDQWNEVAKITASDAAAGDRFGTSVSISGGLVVIGATGVGNGVGAAYIFRRDGAGVWNEVGKIRCQDDLFESLRGHPRGWSRPLPRMLQRGRPAEALAAGAALPPPEVASAHELSPFPSALGDSLGSVAGGFLRKEEGARRSKDALTL